MFICFIDEHVRYKVCNEMSSKTADCFRDHLHSDWLRFFGPMLFLVSDREGAFVSELVGTLCDR